MRGVIPAGFAAGIDRQNPPRNFQYTNALTNLRLSALGMSTTPSLLLLSICYISSHRLPLTTTIIWAAALMYDYA